MSGGERNRLLLARLFAKPANVLVLDEPTNDLDIETLELLEELLENYEGTVFLVSHDRTFLDNVVTQVIASEGEGRWKEYVGGYSDWEKYRTAAPAPSKTAIGKTEQKAAAAAAPVVAKQKKLSYKEQKEFDELPGLIAKMEEEQKTISDRLADQDLYKKSKADDIRKMNERFAELDDLLLTAMEKWEAMGG